MVALSDASGLKVPPSDGLKEARLLAHWAAQIPAAAGSLLPHRPDFSHQALTWHPGEGALLTDPIESAGDVRAGLRVKDLTLVVLEGEARAAEQGLGGSTLREGLSWLNVELKKRGSGRDIVRPDHPLPFHGVSEGVLFDVDQACLEELSRWVAVAAQRLEPIRAAEKRATPVRVWPHHFDVATLITVKAHENPEKAHTIGVGLSPGDEHYDEPYGYVTPWPYPSDDVTLPILPARGLWHLDGFTGAVLGARDMGEDREQALDAFFDSAVAACKLLIAGRG